MTAIDLIDEALTYRTEFDKRVTMAFVSAFRAMSLVDKKTAFLALAPAQQSELLGNFTIAELQAIKTKLQE